MTFRIDSMRLYGDMIQWRIKGICGAGVYGTIQAKIGVHGLRLMIDYDFQSEGEIVDADFVVNAGDDHVSAIREALLRLGWGPEYIDPWKREVSVVEEPNEPSR